MSLEYKDYILDEKAVEDISSVLQDYLRSLGMERRDLQRIRLTVEELLLNIIDGCGKGTAIKVAVGKQAGRHVLRMRYEGEPFDPTASSENTWASEMMRTLGVYPSWSCKGRSNTLSMVLAERKKRGMVFNLLAAIAAAVLLGFLGSFLPEPLCRTLDEAVLTPVSNAFLGLMSTFAGFLIAFTICSGIIGIGNAETLEKMGKQILGRYIGISFLVCILTSAFCLLMLDLRFTSAGLGSLSQLGEISAIIFSILPNDPIQPFMTGNTLQIVVISVFIGVAIIMIGDRGSHLRSLVNEGAALLQYIVTAISYLIPLFVFTMLLKQFWSGELSRLLSVWKPLLFTYLAYLLLTAVFCVFTSLRLHCSPLFLLRSCMPPFIVGLSTASSISALTIGMETCEKKLGVDHSTASFAFPLSSVIFKPTSTAFFTIFSFCFAEIYHVDISVSWLLLVALLAPLLTMALPPIAGSGILAFTILFGRLGIPTEALVVVSAVEVLSDFIDTGFNVMLRVMHLAGYAAKLGKVDRGVLSNEND